MSKEEAIRNANHDTPPDVDVPHSWMGLILWAVGRWGFGVPIAIALVFVYQDLRLESNSKTDLIRSITDVQHANVRALEAMSAAIISNSRAIEELERNTRKP